MTQEVHARQGMPPPVELYIYYRVQACDAAALREAVRAAQRGLMDNHPGLQARLLVRCPAPGAASADPDEATWMETYTHPGGMPAELHERIERALRALPGMPAARHVEAFVPCA
ncbi:MAG: DUF4936 family protein [Aquabacterium sp.]|nr:DUF4936 family protein [Aquabacterium sp.]